ncbi:MAG: cation:proton antiporter [Thermomicrobiales bacterium]
MEDVRLIVTLFMALGVAVLGGMVARRLGLPVLVGYVVAGIIVGPNSPGVVADSTQVTLLANLGVAFLMFALGVEFSIGHLMEVRRIALVAASFQYPLTFALGTICGILFGWDLPAAILLGGVFVISSSIVMIKLLSSRGETTSWHARIAFGLSVVQDLSLVPLLALLPLLSGDSGNLWPSLLRSVLTATIALALVLILGLRVVPVVLYWVAKTGSRELFLITIVVFALGTAFASHEAHLSFALGAFLAGLVISESEFATEALAEIIPLRDLFSTLFFVSLGMLLEPSLLLKHPFEIAFFVVALVVGKIAISSIAYMIAGVEAEPAIHAALYMAQIGEFSFVLAGVGLADHILNEDHYGIILSVALVSILVSPFLPGLLPRLSRLAHRFAFVRRHDRQIEVEEEAVTLRRHVVICGFGRVGNALGEALHRKGFSYVVIDLNPAIVRELRAKGIPAIYGDSSAESVLQRARVDSARSVAVTIPDLFAARGTTRVARRLSPDVDIVTRANFHGDVNALMDVGANETVQPEFEAGQEFVRYVLRRQGVSTRETESLIRRRRASFYHDVQEDLVFREE